MLKLLSKIQAWKHSEDGATAIEYGLIAAGIAIAISAIVFTVGDNLVALFTAVNADLAEGAARAGS